MACCHGKAGRSRGPPPGAQLGCASRHSGVGAAVVDPAAPKGRTRTALDNARPAWLAHLHAALDRAVWAAYGWEGEPGETSDEGILGRLLALNGERQE